MRLIFKPPKIFYGWWIVGACFLIALYTSGVVFYGFTAIFEPIAEEFGWSYTEISLAASIRGLEAGLLAPVIGMFVDRWGPKRLIFGGVVFTVLGLILLSRITSLGMFYFASILTAIGISSSGTSVTMTAIANWFRRKVAIASGIMIAGYGFGGLLVPVMVRLVDQYQWRTALVILALGMLVVGLPLSLLVRHKPEQYGFLPDGEVSGAVVPGGGPSVVHTAELNIGARQALKSRSFWHIVLALVPQFLVVAAVVTHVMPYLSSFGVARATSGAVATAIPLFSIGGRLGFGWLGDRLNKKRLAAAGLTMLMLGLLSFEFTSTLGTGLLVPFLIFFGMGYGGNVIMLGVLLREYFGRGNFGAILGLAWGILILSNAGGPPIAGWVFDHWGSYQGVWLAFAGLTFLGVVIMMLTPPVNTKNQ